MTEEAGERGQTHPGPADAADLIVPARGRRERPRRVVWMVAVSGRQRRAVVGRRRDRPML